MHLLAFILPIALYSIASHGIALAEVKICEIKYNQQGLAKRKEKKKIENLLNNKKEEECHLIGNEYDKHGNEIPEKPIYACCLSNS